MMTFLIIGAIIRSRATWYEKGEKNNKYFLNLEKSNKKKSCVRKILTSDEILTMHESQNDFIGIRAFFSILYKTKSDKESERKLSPIRCPNVI